MEGPYKYVGTAVPVFAHNCELHAFTNATGEYFALLHIGTGNNTAPPKVCNATGEVVEDIPLYSLEDAANNIGSTLHIASNPLTGPYVAVPPGPNNGNCNNPSSMVSPNGTVYVLCDSHELFSAPSFDSPVWDLVTVVSSSNGVKGSYEDGFLYRDLLGNYHIIYHVYDLSQQNGATVSGHAYSADLINWTQQTVQPFPNWYMREDGTNVTVGTRERPKMVFDAQGNPTHLFSAVCGVASCKESVASQCKLDYWDYLLVAPIV
jgi:hypothetical protein